MAVSFHYDVPSFYFPARTALKAFIIQSFKQTTGKELELSIVFCSDAYLLDINRRMLQHDYYTDIITFPLADTTSQVDAEIYISIDRVRDNAASYGVAFLTELNRVMFHGVLHLAGHGDKTPAEQTAMCALEDDWMRAYELI
jgi:probable rRNA maturation factor